jgi:hypothetical protein
MGRLRLFGELIEAGGAVEGGGGGSGGGGHQISRVVRTAGDYVINSTTFVDIDTANLVINMTTGASWVLLLLLGTAYTFGQQTLCLDFTIDGTRQGQAKGVQCVLPLDAQDIQATWLAQVAAGSHIFRPQGMVDFGWARLRASSAETPLLFAVLELQ